MNQPKTKPCKYQKPGKPKCKTCGIPKLCANPNKYKGLVIGKVPCKKCDLYEPIEGDGERVTENNTSGT